MSNLSDAALAVAITQIGQKEDPLGSNWGHPVKDYLASVDIDFPASWCMALVYWCFKQAQKTMTEKTAFGFLPKTGGVLNSWRMSGATHRVTTNPQPGDIFIMDHGHGLGHTGIVEKVDPDGTLHTIEGNTNDTGSREGIEVDRKIRHQVPPIIGYLRY